MSQITSSQLFTTALTIFADPYLPVIRVIMSDYSTNQDTSAKYPSNGGETTPAFPPYDRTTINVSAWEDSNATPAPVYGLSGKVQLGGNCMRDPKLLSKLWNPYREKLSVMRPDTNTGSFEWNVQQSIASTLSPNRKFDVHYVSDHTMGTLEGGDGWRSMPEELFSGETDQNRLESCWRKLQRPHIAPPSVQ